MKRALAILLALMMLLSSASFAAPTMVSSVTTAQENSIKESSVPDEEAELTSDEVDFVDEKYGNLVFNLDFETDTAFANGINTSQMYKHGVVNPKYETNQKWWIKAESNYFPSITKETEENGNTFLRLTNGKVTPCQLMFESGLVATSGNLTTFTGENGYYTFFYDVRVDISGNSGATFTKLSGQIMNRYWDGTTYQLFTTNFADVTADKLDSEKWTTVQHTQNAKYHNSFVLDSLSRYRPFFNYDKAPTTAGVDKFDIDNVKLYFKPYSVDVKVLGSGDVKDKTVTIDIADDLKSVYTKSELIALVNKNGGAKCIDLTLSDGTAFEKIDVVAVNEVKATYKTYQVNHPQYGTLLYDLDFETDVDYKNYQSLADQGFVNTAFEGYDRWCINSNLPIIKDTKNGNSFVVIKNSGQYPQFQVMSLNPTSGVFTKENGYYTIMADAKIALNEEAGNVFKEFRTQAIFQKANGSTHAPGANNTKLVSGDDFVTSTISTLYYDSHKAAGEDAPVPVDALRRINYLFEYDIKDKTPVNNTDDLYIDNIKLYFKPAVTKVTLLGDGVVADRVLEVKPSAMDYVVTKSDIMSLIGVEDNIKVADLTLSDGTAFETVDLDEVKTFKAVYTSYDAYDDTYGHLLYDIDFETGVDYKALQYAYLQGFVNADFEGSENWNINVPGANNTVIKTEKITENGNKFLRMTNILSQHHEFHVMSLSTSSGVFTQENGYYTVFADVRNNISGNAGVDFKNFWLQSGFWKNGAQTNPSSGNYVPTKEFTTTKIPLYVDGADALMRIKHVFTYDGVPTATGVDTFDIDNVKLYFKPLSVDVTVLGGENTEFVDKTVNVAISSDLDSTITKAELMALVENDTDMILSDLTLSDGTAFESIDVMKVTQVKAVWTTLAPTSYNSSSIRINAPSGIRFRASVNTIQREKAAQYGFIVTLESHLGENDATALTMDSGIKMVKGVNYGYDEASGKNVDRIFESDEDNIFFTAAVYGIPATKEAYSEQIVVRPFLMDKDGAYYYGDPIVKSVLDAAVAIRDGGYAVVDDYGREYVEGILEICGEEI